MVPSCHRGSLERWTIGNSFFCSWKWFGQRKSKRMRKQMVWFPPQASLGRCFFFLQDFALKTRFGRHKVKPRLSFKLLPPFFLLHFLFRTRKTHVFVRIGFASVTLSWSCVFVAEVVTVTGNFQLEGGNHRRCFCPEVSCEETNCQVIQALTLGKIPQMGGHLPPAEN